MANLNEINLIGRVGFDPESRYTPSGTQITTFSFYTTDSWTDKQTGERKEASQRHRIEAWGRQAEVLSEHVRKGSELFIKGSMKYGSYEKDVGGEKVTIPTAAVKLHSFQFLGSKPKGEANKPAPKQATTATEPTSSDDVDDIPF